MKYQTEVVELEGEVFEVPLIRRDPDFGNPYKWASTSFGRASEYRKNLPPKEEHVVLDLRLDSRAWTREHASSEDYKRARKKEEVPSLETSSGRVFVW